jgi:putative endonuclease
MYFVYILYSEKCDRYYIGYSVDVITRLQRHNAGMVTATKNCQPYIIKATKEFPTEIDARKEELRLKKQKNRKYLDWLIAGNWQTRPD